MCVLVGWFMQSIRCLSVLPGEKSNGAIMGDNQWSKAHYRGSVIELCVTLSCYFLGEQLLCLSNQ